MDIKNEAPKNKEFIWIDDKPDFNFSMEQKLWEPTKTVRLNSEEVEDSLEEIDVDALYQHLYVNPEILRERIRVLLRGKTQISLSEIASEIPIEKGLSELITYFSIATSYEKQNQAVINEEKKEVIQYSNNGKVGQLELPQTIFMK